MQRSSESARDAEGILGAGFVLEGKLDGRANVRIEGTFQGEIALDGALILGNQAQVNGPIRARLVEVHGEVHGRIDAQEVFVRAGGWVDGDVRAGSLTIDDGATLEGLVETEADFGGAR